VRAHLAGRRDQRARLQSSVALDYLRTLVWPVVALAVLAYAAGRYGEHIGSRPGGQRGRDLVAPTSWKRLLLSASRREGMLLAPANAESAEGEDD